MEEKRKFARKEQKQESSHKTELTTASVTVTTDAEVQKQVLGVVAQAIGLKDENLAAYIIDQAGKMQGCCLLDERERLENALATMLEIKPETITQGFLAVQMVGVHHAAITFLQRAMLLGQSPESINANLARATSLMHLYGEQTEAMLKLKGKTGQQKVTVEHVHVHEGGQAIVGAVSSTAKGAKQSNEK